MDVPGDTADTAETPVDTPADTADALAETPVDGACGGGPDRSARRPFPCRRRPLVVAVGAVAAATVLALVADVALEHTARHRIAQAAACRLRPSGPVRASLSGDLAGLRLLTGRVGSVHIEAADVRRQGMDIAVAVDLRGVTTKGAVSGGTATATVPYADLRSRMGAAAAGLRPSGDGQGNLVLTGTAAGVPLPVTVRTRITTAAGTVTVTPVDVSVFGSDFPVAALASHELTKGLAGRLAPRTVQVPPLPSGVTLTGARAGADGLDLTLTMARTTAHSGSNGCPA
ncbi:LmeA family phospholipid-binding protein [Actinacidiphila yeochonensis]|uniref:LmeA family phospholipid-binding protein n=1 Tax=Actinacidiphila yeochonensis TaxID=89050 RepID=UPI000562182D|nr:DUF2993 domain-containing protein [Actinacidiphila yeochonensis]